MLVVFLHTERVDTKLSGGCRSYRDFSVPANAFLPHTGTSLVWLHRSAVIYASDAKVSFVVRSDGDLIHESSFCFTVLFRSNINIEPR